MMQVNDHSVLQMENIVENSKINLMQHLLFQRIEAENDKNIENTNKFLKVPQHFASLFNLPDQDKI
jgi:hypothetical protein